MREVSFVKRLKFDFNGSITKRALVVGDADNDQRNELVCANLQGDLAIFKEKYPHKFAYASNLGMVTACTIGDVINSGKNYIIAINTEGSLFVFDATCSPTLHRDDTPGPETSPLECESGPRSINFAEVCHQKAASRSKTTCLGELSPYYEQRVPANCKELLLADLDGDGENELIIGLTDRVVRTYKWIKIGQSGGKFVGLYKWEFADQIGSVSLNPSRHENCQDIIVAQPGGTYAKLECFDKKTPTTNSSPNYQDCPIGGGSSDLSPGDQQSSRRAQQQISLDSQSDGDNVKTEYISKLTPEYHQLALAQMRNHHVSTEVLGGIRNLNDQRSSSLIVIATLDGTLMLVNKDEILWSLQVDHQLFALAVLESTNSKAAYRHRHLPQSESACTIVPNHSLDNQSQSITEIIKATTSRNSDGQSTHYDNQYFVACAWNGKTYIIDEERNYLRFKFDEAVSAFTAGNYYFDGEHHQTLIYATFNNQIVLYYDVVSDNICPSYLLNEIVSNPDNVDLLEHLKTLADIIDDSKTCDDTQQQDNDQVESLKMTRLHNILQDVLYSISDSEISTPLTFET